MKMCAIIIMALFSAPVLHGQVAEKVRKDLGEAFSVLGRYDAEKEGEEGGDPPVEGAAVRDKTG